MQNRLFRMRHAARSRSLAQTTFSFTATWRIAHVEKVRSYYDNFADYNDRIHCAKRCHDSLSSGSSTCDCERFADVVIYTGQLRSCTNCRLTSQNREVKCGVMSEITEGRFLDLLVN